MFRFSVLLAFLFAALFGPSKATPFKKKGLRRHVEASKPMVANGLAAFDATHLVLDDTAVHMDDSDSDSDDDGPRRRRRRRPTPGKLRCRRCKSKRCRRKCLRRGNDSDSDSDSDSD